MGSQKKWRRYLVLLGALLIYITQGTLFSFANMTTYLTSYIRTRSHSESVTYAQSSWISGLLISAMGAFTGIGGLLSLRIGPRWTTLIGSGIMSLGLLLTYFTMNWSFHACVFSFGIMPGIGIGIAYSTPSACAMKWFPHHTGLINGLVLAGFGGAELITAPAQTAFINPDNKAPDMPEIPGSNQRYFSEDNASDVLDRLPQSVLILAVVHIVLQLIGCCLLMDPQEEKEEELEQFINQSKNENINRNIKIGAPVYCSQDVSPRQVLREKPFYLICTMFSINSVAATIFGSLYKVFGQTFIRDDRFLVTIVSLSALCNAFGRVFWGRLVDKSSFRTLMTVISSLMWVSLLTFPVSALLDSRVMYAVWVMGIRMMSSGNSILLPTVLYKAFGSKYLSANLGLAMSSYLITGIAAAALASSTVDTIGWFGLYLMLATFPLISGILGFLLNTRGPDGSYI